MTISDEDVQAYVDGELSPEASARVEAAIAADVLVAARVERVKRLRATRRGAFDPTRDAPAPSRVSGAVAREADDAPTPSAARQPSDDARRQGRWRRPLIALVAAVAALAIVGWLRRPAGDIAMRGDVLVARGELARQLDTALAGAPETTSTVSIGVTFRDLDGRVCRSFATAATRMAGLACRDGDAWTLPVVSRIDAATGDGPSLHGGTVPEAVRAAIDARLRGDVFDAAAEREARDAGWR